MAPVSLEYTSNYQLPLAEYIFRRIESIGIKHIFGVPGDYNLSMLEHLYSVSNLNWVGCCNELNSAYAADGYSRMIGANKFGVVLTTQGVGELSALNGISGAFAEHVPLLHIVGTTRTDSKSSGAHLHHIVDGKTTFENTNHYVYEQMIGSVSCMSTSLTEDLSNAANQIDELFNAILTSKRPGYLYVPCDLVNLNIDGSNLNNLPGEELCKRRKNLVNEENIDQIAKTILNKLSKSSQPLVLADIFIDRYGLTSQVQEFVDKLNIPHCNSHMGKTLMDEDNKHYIGDYNGDESNKQVRSYAQGSDCFIHFGDYYNEINSGHFTLYEGIPDKNIIRLNQDRVIVDGETFIVSFEDVLPSILSNISFFNFPTFTIPEIKIEIEQIPSSTPISQTFVLEKFQHFFKPGDVVITETCSLMFGFPDLKMPTKSKVIGQHYYLSIGMALPCSFGVSVAMKEMGHSGRLIVIQGDGAAQMTIQEWANFNRENCVKPFIFLLNNNGYTVERIIKGAERDYNDIRPNWKWTEIFNVFGVDAMTAKVEEVEEFERAIEIMGNKTDVPRLLEVTLDKMDVPWRFHKMVGN